VTAAASDPDCVFCKIIAGDLPCKKVYEDEELLAFHDIAPGAPVHFLILPKVHLESMLHVDEGHQALLGRILGLAPRLAMEQGCNPYPDGGFRIMVNTGLEGGQEVAHLHFHVMGGARSWKKGQAN